MNSEIIIKEIDEMHQLSKDALAQKRLESYLEIFSENLTYKQLDGKVIDKKELARNTASYFNRLKNATSKFVRKKYSIEGNRFTENLIQTATASIKVFIFFTKRWTVEREGIYEWVKIEGKWKIEKVEILNEKIY